MNPKKMFRSANRMIAGVCGGVAEHFGIDSAMLRLKAKHL